MKTPNSPGLCYYWPQRTTLGKNSRQKTKQGDAWLCLWYIIEVIIILLEDKRPIIYIVYCYAFQVVYPVKWSRSDVWSVCSYITKGLTSSSEPCKQVQVSLLEKKELRGAESRYLSYDSLESLSPNEIHQDWPWSVDLNQISHLKFPKCQKEWGGNWLTALRGLDIIIDTKNV